MTTAVVLSAAPGVKVEVTARDPASGEVIGPVQLVEPGRERTFYVHAGQDLHIHETVAARTDEIIQPDDGAQIRLHRAAAQAGRTSVQARGAHLHGVRRLAGRW